MVKSIWNEAASPPRTVNSVVFASWRQCACAQLIRHTVLSAPPILPSYSIDSAVFAGHTLVTNRQTDRQTDHTICVALSHILFYALRCSLTKINCREKTRETRCFVYLVQYAEVDAQCDKRANVVGRTSTVASAVNLVRPTTVVSLSHWASAFVQVEACSLHMNWTELNSSTWSFVDKTID